jgi:hypothetical protein
MIAILLGAWVFCMVSFSAVGVGCRIACHRRRALGRACICGRHEHGPRRLASVADRAASLAGGSARLRAAEKRVRALQRRFVEGRLSMEQYESELDRVVGLA